MGVLGSDAVPAEVFEDAPHERLFRFLMLHGFPERPFDRRGPPPANAAASHCTAGLCTKAHTCSKRLFVGGRPLNSAIRVH